MLHLWTIPLSSESQNTSSQSVLIDGHSKGLFDMLMFFLFCCICLFVCCCLFLVDLVIACAPLVESELIELRQYKVGDISLSQRSPFEDTVLTSTNTRTMVCNTELQYLWHYMHHSTPLHALQDRLYRDHHTLLYSWTQPIRPFQFD